ncbi:MAG: type IX secretion system membrane protein PorP/SprF [Lentimicrobiaceae bacterium]|nr:type IX secretion system membrane protein PorP/SprF [Lentimicrobiaceae bacterium]MCO5264447.1 type IX secretion system membrane protein PorP/SprF [Lentimicrobium sp.]HPG33077.1 type IX secretion system membrane protein PorP/SprF [Lentimicrobium sp.]
MISLTKQSFFRNLLKPVILLVICGMLPFGVSAQQEPQITLNMFNHMAVNPGYAGLRDAICVTGIIRQQWMGIEDAEGTKVSPETYVISGDSPVRLLRGGVSAVVMQDKIGYFKDVYVKLGYAYNRSLGDGELGIGFNVGFLNKSLDFSKFKPVDAGDQLLQGGNESTMFTDLAVGAFYIQPNGLYMGLSATQLLEGSRQLGTGTAGTEFKLRRHYYATAGYEISWIRNPAFVLIPGVFAKYDGSTIQLDFNTILQYNQKFWGGLTYRIQETAAVMVGMKVKDISFGYAYDIPLSRIGGAGSHEVMVRYCFKLELEKARRSFRNTRFL